MNKTPSPFCIQTESGKLELTKGSYLTLQKRKSEIFKTVKKTKQISHTQNQKRTLTRNTKQQNRYPNRVIKSTKNELALRDSNKNIFLFRVGHDRELF